MSSHIDPKSLILPTIDPFLRWADRTLQNSIHAAASRVLSQEAPTAETLGLSLDDSSVYAGILRRLAAEIRAVLGIEYLTYLNHPRRGARYLAPEVASFALSTRLEGAGVIVGVADLDQRLTELAYRMARRALRRLTRERSSAAAAAHQRSRLGGADEKIVPQGRRPVLAVVRGKAARAGRVRRAVRRHLA